MSTETPLPPANHVARRPHRKRLERNPDTHVIITDRDRAVFKLLTILRVATVELLFPLVAGESPTGFESLKVLGRRLLKLYDTEYVARPLGQTSRKKHETLPRGRQRELYALGNKGAAELRAHGLALTKTDYNAKADALKPLSLPHLVATADAVATFLLAFRGREDVELLDVRPDGKWQTSVMLSSHGRQVRYPIKPDATFIVREAAEKKTAFFLEVDRDTMPAERTDHEQSSFLRKVTGYLTYRDDRRRLKDELGVEDFTVLTVTTTPPHAAALRTLVVDANPKRSPTELDLFWFTTSTELRSHGPAGPLAEYIWTTPQGETGFLL